MLRSHGGWAGRAALRRDREAYLGTVRVLGSSAFVAQCQHAAAAPRSVRRLGLAPATLQGGGRSAQHTRARAGIAYLWTEGLGRPGRPLAPVLGVFPAAVYKAARRGAAEAAAWQRLLGRDLPET